MCRVRGASDAYVDMSIREGKRSRASEANCIMSLLGMRGWSYGDFAATVMRVLLHSGS